MANEILGVFSEDQTERLTGVSKRQLAYWDKTDLFHPSHMDDHPGTQFRRLYSFRDLLELRVLGQLKNEIKVRMPHLRDVKKKLSELPDSRWSSQKLWVVNGEVVWENPGLRAKEGIISQQTVMDIALRVVISSVREKLAEMNIRGADKIGKVEQSKRIAHNRPVLAGTRIAVDAIKSFAEAGYSAERIVREYPSLTVADVEAAIAYDPLVGTRAA